MVLSSYEIALRWVNSVLCAVASQAVDDKPFVQWIQRTAHVDSLYVEGRFEHYHSPIDADIDDRTQWIRRQDLTEAEFQLWLRRPDYRVRLLRPPYRETEGDVKEFAWVDQRLTAVGDLDNVDPARWGADIHGVSRRGRLSLWPVLTPLEYHFFDWEVDNYPSQLLKRPRRTEGAATVVELTRIENWGSMLARIEFDPDSEVPRRLTSLSGDDPERRITWDMLTLETQVVNNVPIIRSARFALYNPGVRRDHRVIYLYEATRIEKRPITRADLEIQIPDGVQVNDFVNEKVWIAGQEDAVQDLDMEEFRKAAQAVQAQLVSPEIRAARKSAMTWIVVLGVTVGAVLTAMGLYIRRLRRG